MGPCSYVWTNGSPDVWKVEVDTLMDHNVWLYDSHRPNTFWHPRNEHLWKERCSGKKKVMFQSNCSGTLCNWTICYSVWENDFPCVPRVLSSLIFPCSWSRIVDCLHGLYKTVKRTHRRRERSLKDQKSQQGRDDCMKKGDKGVSLKIFCNANNAIL